MRNCLEENDHFTPSGVMEGIVIQRSNPIQTSRNLVGLSVEPIMDQVPINWNGIIARIVGVPGEPPSNSKWISFVVEKFHRVLHLLPQLEPDGYQGPAGWNMFTYNSKWNFGLTSGEKFRPRMIGWNHEDRYEPVQGSHREVYPE